MRPQLASRIVVATLVAAVVAALGSARPAGAVFPGNLRGEVVFTSDRDGDAELYAMTNDGLGQRRLTVRRSQEVGASLAVQGLNPFNNGAVTYASDRDGNWDVYVLRVGLDERRLTTHAGGDFAPSFSPRGNEIAFTSDRSGNRDIWVASSTAPESGLRNVTANPAEDSGAAWSSWTGQPRPTPDSVSCSLAAPRIAFHSNRGGSFDIWVVPETGGAAVQVTSGPAADLNPNWSPRCDFIAFERRTGSNYDIWAVRLSNGELTRLTSGAAADTDPVWAPNGTAIAFTSDRDGNEEIYRVELSLGPPLAPGALTNLSQSPAAADYAAEWEPRDFTFSEGLIVAPAAGGGRGALTCTRRGTARRDRITGTSGPDVICGLGGNDTIRGMGGDDVLIGGLGRDRLRGGNGRDELRARDGFRDFELVGGPGVDRARYDEGWDPRPGVESAL